MRKIIFTVAFILASFISAHAENKTKVYDFGDIRSLDVGHLYRVHVTEGTSGKVRVEYDSKFEDNMEIKYNEENGRLSIMMSDNILRSITLRKSNSNTNQSPINVYLEMDKISDINLSGACNVTFEGNYKVDDLDVELSGASKLVGLNISGRSLEMDCSGACSCTIGGELKEYIELDGSGAVKLNYLGNCNSFSAEISGASKLYASIKCKKIDISCQGASKAEVIGSAEEADYECSGASAIVAKELVAKKVKASLSGASKAEVHAAENLSYMVSKASKIIYYGTPILKNISIDNNVIQGE